jgi:sn-glycerol 3-phosphate transport system ATP-binding protein
MRVRFEGVGKRFGAQDAVRGIDLDVASGECLVLLGPSGCGKSTLLRLLAGLERPDEGRILIGERVVNDVPPAARDVALVFQSYALYPHFTVFENIAFPLRARKTPDPEVRERVHAAAARLELQALLDRRPAQLSGGQQQRVALARAIVRRPAVFLMDEPLSNLDAQLRVQTRGELKRLQQELGVTTLYVTHDQGEAMTLGTRVAVLRAGAVEQVATPLDLYRKPATRFVAAFVGSPAINLWPAAGEDGALRAAGLRFPLSGVVPPPTGPVEVGLRPEDVDVALTPGQGAQPAEVVVVEPMGNETIVVLQREGTRVTARVGPDVAPRPGATVWIRPLAGRALVFDAASGRRLG